MSEMPARRVARAGYVPDGIKNCVLFALIWPAGWPHDGLSPYNHAISRSVSRAMMRRWISDVPS